MVEVKTTIKTVEGSPYSAKFIGQDDHTLEHSYAYAVVEPPFGVDETIYAIAFNNAASVEPLVTTKSKIVLEIDVPEVRPDQTHDARLEVAYRGLSNLVRHLNNIENGTFEHF